jgi:hypothetical protein
MTKICGHCQKALVWPDIFNCFFCQKQYCDSHYQAENHNCPKVAAAKHIKGDYLRERGVNITSGRYRVECKIHGSVTDYSDIEDANQQRITHIKQNNCPPQSVWLKEHEEDRKADIEFVKTNLPQPKEADNWMYQCLAEAKSIIKRYHTDYDTRGFFANTTYDLYIQHDNEHAYAYINLIGESSHFPIGIHPALSENTPQNQKMLVIVLIHELLHAIHDREGWGHDKINPLERKLANLGGYYDALVELENLALNGKMRFCNE